jgi:threonylcarbamoyladenosine tRNA methylthiotransferase MtaB
MPQVPPALIKQRAAQLRAAAARRKASWLQSLVGTRQRVLVERDGRGHAENFALVRAPAAGEPGKIMEMTITGMENGLLNGEEA